MRDYKNIIQYIEFLKSTYGLEITIKDYKGFVYENETMEFMLRPYLAHTNPYCMFVKEKDESYSKCLKNNRLLIDECIKKDFFLHYCHAGICELIIPIKENKKVYGSINISHFNISPKKSQQLVGNTFKTEERKTEGKRKFKVFARSTFVDCSTLVPGLKLLSSYLLLLIKNSSQNKDNVEIADEEKLRNYIQENISHKIVADNITTNLKISRNQLTNIIKNSGMKNIRAYVNTIRIEMSEKLLLNTNKSPKEIALSLGFKGYKHFENLFKEKVNISPDDYRKYYINEKHY